MKQRVNKALYLFLFVSTVLLVAYPRTARAQQVSSNQTTVTLNATVVSSINVSVGVASVSFSPQPGTKSTGSPTIPIITKWNLGGGTTATSLTTWAYFADPTSALANAASGNKISSTLVLGALNGVAAGAFTGSSPFAAASSLSIQKTTVKAGGVGAAGTGANCTDATCTAGTASNNLALTLDLTTVTDLPAGAYTGTLFIVAQAL